MKYKNFNEGNLSKKYSYLVQKDFLYQISMDLSLDKILLYNFKKNNKKMIKSVFSDAVESLIGAIYIDSGYKYSFNFIKKFWDPYIDVDVSDIQDPKTKLQELSQQKLKKLQNINYLKKKDFPFSIIYCLFKSIESKINYCKGRIY